MIQSFSQLDIHRPEKEVFTVTLMRYCDTANQIRYTSVLYASKVLLLVYGVFLAWETRHITIAELNDSKQLYRFLLLYMLLLVFVADLGDLETYAHILSKRSKN